MLIDKGFKGRYIRVGGEIGSGLLGRWFLRWILKIIRDFEG